MWPNQLKIRTFLYDLLIGLVLFVSVLFYQNCANDESPGSSSKVYDTPFPLEANMNQISLMTCPHSSNNSPTVYGLRIGAYDNSRFAGNWGILNTVDINNRLIAGVGLTKEFMDRYPSNTTTEKFNDYLSNSTWKDVQPLIASLSKNYSLDQQLSSKDGNTFSIQLLSPLSNLDFVNTLSENTSSVYDFGTIKQSYFPKISDSLVGSIEISTIPSFLSNFFQNYELVLGFSQHSYDANSEYPEFAKPKNETNQKVGFGKKYSLSYSNGLLLGVSERNFTDNSPVNSNWECFSFIIVRDADRREGWTGTGALLSTDPTTSNPNSTEPSIVGKKKCQVQTTQNISNTEKIKLDIARRFLPANYWEINTVDGCAVPPPGNEVDCLGSTYAQHPNTSNQAFIQYSNNCIETSSNICAPKISICYRKN